MKYLLKGSPDVPQDFDNSHVRNRRRILSGGPAFAASGYFGSFLQGRQTGRPGTGI
jgi:hypothetical protein